MSGHPAHVVDRKLVGGVNGLNQSLLTPKREEQLSRQMLLFSLILLAVFLYIIKNL